MWSIRSGVLSFSMLARMASRRWAMPAGGLWAAVKAVQAASWAGWIFRVALRSAWRFSIICCILAGSRWPWLMPPPIPWWALGAASAGVAGGVWAKAENPAVAKRPASNRGEKRVLKVEDIQNSWLKRPDERGCIRVKRSLRGMGNSQVLVHKRRVKFGQVLFHAIPRSSVKVVGPPCRAKALSAPVRLLHE